MRKLLFLTMATVMILSGCKKDDENSNSTDNNLPAKIAIDLPTSISVEQTPAKSATTQDTIKGNEIYNHLRTFIWVGESAAKIVEDIIIALRKYNINKPMDLYFTSNDDARTKRLVVVEDQSYQNKNYKFELTMTDSASNATAMQIYWNTDPVEGIAILDAYEINHNELRTGTKFVISYGEGTISPYEKHMEVSVIGWPVIGVYGLDNLKMFVGKQGDILDIWGNSNHPHAVFIDHNVKSGFNYAFAARVDQVKNISVVNLALPQSDVNTNEGIFINYSITKLLGDEMHRVWDPFADGDPIKLAYIEKVINKYLESAQIPAYFKSSGFVSCGTNKPAEFTDDFVNISSLKPYVPNDIKNLTVSFGK